MGKPVLPLTLSLLLAAALPIMGAWPCLARAHAETTVRFSTGVLDLGVGITVELNLTIRVEVGNPIPFTDRLAPLVPPVAFSGLVGELGVRVSGEAGSIAVTYGGTPYSKEFPTPVGGIKVAVASVPLGSLYARLSGRVGLNVSSGGPISISPTELDWKSEGVRKTSISHGPLWEEPLSMLALGITELTMRFSYVLGVAIGVEVAGALFETPMLHVGPFTGSPDVSVEVWLIPAVPIAGGIILLAIVVAVLRHRRRALPPFEQRRWVKCPRCGYEFSA